MSSEGDINKTSDTPKGKPKAIRVLTVLAYVLSVSMAAILLSIYYIFMWQGRPHLGAFAGDAMGLSDNQSNYISARLIQLEEHPQLKKEPYLNQQIDNNITENFFIMINSTEPDYNISRDATSDTSTADAEPTADPRADHGTADHHAAGNHHDLV
ncbi:trp-interacting inaF-D isoform X3 [Rhynchophorus ferrugineus]|uniref:trp-interacting inaF-D isoform X3 n=1 Tax=Rhynchophorus ferrugineus TaxID=354439 RepID=UPI003FCCAD0D